MQTHAPPPSYAAFVDDELPGYSRPPPPPPPPAASRNRQNPREFSYELKNRKGRPWLTMTLLGDALLSKQVPTVIEGGSLEGRVDLTLDSSDGIQAVTITALGRIITGANAGESYTFLEIPLTLWSKASNEHSQSTSDEDGRGGSKLFGQHSWPYKLDLPKQVTLRFGSAEPAQAYSLPQTFLERHSRVSVQYDLVLRTSRGKLRPDSKLTATFGFMPIVKPTSPSPLRQLAYQENSLLLGPEADPDGWLTLTPTLIRGTVFGQRLIEVHCSLSIAKPLSYTRGTVIPCFLELRSADLQALDLLSSPNAVVLRLRRRIVYRDHNLSSSSKMEIGVSTRDSISHSESAVWWPSTEGAAITRDSPRRCLSGEVHLQKNLKPTTAMGNFRIEYSIALFPFDAPAFTSSGTDPLLAHPVEIATAYAPGPRPRIYSPPIYQAPPKVDAFYALLPATEVGFF